MDLIASYQNSDSEDDSDPWARSRVSVKRTAGDEERPVKIAKRLPKPSINLAAQVSREELPIDDDPSLHGGRVRSFPHERGNWASYIYIPAHVSHELRGNLQRLVKFCSPALNLISNEEFHISLTRTVVLRHHWLDDFTASFRKSLSTFHCFSIYVQNLEVYVNEEQTRTFLGLRIWDPAANLTALVARTDALMAEFNLSTFYENPSFHVSVAWCVGNRRKELEELLGTFPEPLHEETYFVDRTECKVGHLKYTCPLLR